MHVVSNTVNVCLSLLVLVGLAAGLILVSFDWIAAFAPVAVVVIVYLNLDLLMALCYRPEEDPVRK